MRNIKIYTSEAGEKLLSEVFRKLLTQEKALKTGKQLGIKQKTKEQLEDEYKDRTNRDDRNENIN